MFSRVLTGSVERLPRTLLAATCLAGMLGAAPAAAQDILGDRSFYGLDPIADEQLADLRGGFMAPMGLLYFTIDLQGAIDDGNSIDTLYNLSLAWDGIGDPIVTGSDDGDQNVSFDTGALISVIQNGDPLDNTIDDTAFADALGIVNVIQNSENNVTIQQLTDITLGLDASNLANPGTLDSVVDQLQALSMMGLL